MKRKHAFPTFDGSAASYESAASHQSLCNTCQVGNRNVRTLAYLAPLCAVSVRSLCRVVCLCVQNELSELESEPKFEPIHTVRAVVAGSCTALRVGMQKNGGAGLMSVMYIPRGSVWICRKWGRWLFVCVRAL